jgi:hypothetical protein
MKLQEVKKESEICLTGVLVEIERRENEVADITFSDGLGGFLKVAPGRYSGLSLLIPAEPKLVEGYRLSGKFLGLVEVLEDFDTKYRAERELEKYAEAAGPGVEHGLSIKQVEVPEEDEA